MEKNDIRNLINRKFDTNNLDNLAKMLSINYKIERKTMDDIDIVKSLTEMNPVIIQGRIIIEVDQSTRTFEDSEGDSFKVQRPVDAIKIISVKEVVEAEQDCFLILGKNDLGYGSEKLTGLLSLKIGPVFIPPHSAILNFINPTEKEKKEKIVSVLSGVNINIYELDNCFDNILHEIGHLFWRCSMLPCEHAGFKKFFDYMKPSALFDYEWEKSDEQETFCTIYKWYMKSLLLNKSFYNILKHEQPEGLTILEDVFNRIAKDRIVSDVWELSKDSVYKYLNPKFDVKTGTFLINKKIGEDVRSLEVPRSILSDISSYENGTTIVNLEKGKSFPVTNKRIDTDKLNEFRVKTMAKASDKDKITIYMDMDGVVADFVKGYEEKFGSIKNADSFTVSQNVISDPLFFTNLDVIERGKQLYHTLKREGYNIKFLTTPMDGFTGCKTDKVEWIVRIFGGTNTVIFSSDKWEYAKSDHDILIDDMDYNLKPFENAGGTAIDFTKNSNQEIIDIIKEVQNPVREIKEIQENLKNLSINTEPTIEQIESGNYKKGDIMFKGLKIKIENPKGSIRTGFGSDGLKWVNKLKNHYGYITGSEGNDNDPVDVFIGPKYNGNKVFIVNQSMMDIFDEHKVILCAESIEEAKEIYLQNYEKGWEKNILSIVPSNTKKLRLWLKEGNKTEPFPN